MDLLKFYQVGKDGRSDIPNGSEISLLDLLDSQESRGLYEYPVRRDEVGKIQKMTDLKSSIGRKIFRCIFAAHGLDISENIKDFERVHYDLRKKIIDTNRPMLSFIDRPEFLFGAYPYFLLAFSFQAGHSGFEGVNGVDALYSVLERIYSNTNREIETYFCAHRENKEIKRHSLRQVPNFEGLLRILNLIFGVFENLGESQDNKIRINFKQPGGDDRGIQNVFPNIFFRHFREGTIGEVLSSLDSHIIAMNEFLTKLDNKDRKYSFLTTSLETEYQEVENFLENLFEKKFLSVSKSDLEGRSDSFLHIVKEKTLDDVERIVSLHREQSEGLDIDKLIELNLSNTTNPDERNNVERSIRAYIQGFDPIRKALYETALYQNWGQHIAGLNGGIAFGFERDHAEYQSEAFKLGFSGSNANVPIIYARHSDSRLIDGKLKNLGLRQFWYY